MRIGYLLVFLTALINNAGAQQWQWAVEAAVNGGPYALALDQQENVLVTGNTSDSMGRYCFLIKHDSLGNSLWQKRFRHTHMSGTVSSNAVKCDQQGNIFIAGSFIDTLDLIDTILYSSTYKAFVASFTPSGSFRYSFTLGSSANCRDMCLDDQGGIYITGSFRGTIGNISAVRTKGDLFLAKLDTSGNIQMLKHGWAKDTINSSAFATGDKVLIDACGDIVLACFAEYETDVQLDNLVLPQGPGPKHVPFLVKYDQQGNILWAEVDHNGIDAPVSLSSDAQCNIYTSGDDSWHYGGGFIKQFGPQGNPSWDHRFGSTLYPSTSWSMDAVSDGNNVYSVGMCLVNYDPNNNYNQFKYLTMRRLDLQGNITWNDTTVSTYQVSSARMAARNGRIYITGYTLESAVFGNDTIDPSAQYSTMFIARMDDTTSTIVSMSEQQDAHLTIYPNPSAGAVSITLPNGNANEHSLVIYNLLGQKIKEETVKGANVIELQLPVKGVYYITLRTADKISAGRVIIK